MLRTKWILCEVKSMTEKVKQRLITDVEDITDEKKKKDIGENILEKENTEKKKPNSNFCLGVSISKNNSSRKTEQVK